MPPKCPSIAGTLHHVLESGKPVLWRGPSALRLSSPRGKQGAVRDSGGRVSNLRARSGRAGESRDVACKDSRSKPARRRRPWLTPNSPGISMTSSIPRHLDLRVGPGLEFRQRGPSSGTFGKSAEADTSWRQAAASLKSWSTRALAGSIFALIWLSSSCRSLCHHPGIGLKAEAERDFRRAVDILERSLCGGPRAVVGPLSAGARRTQFRPIPVPRMTDSKNPNVSTDIAFKNYERLFFENYQQEVDGS